MKIQGLAPERSAKAEIRRLQNPKSPPGGSCLNEEGARSGRSYRETRLCGSPQNPGTTFQVMRAQFHVFAQTQSVVYSTANPCGYGASAASNLRKNGAEPVEP